MKLGAIVLVWLSTDGYWFGGSKATIGSQWAAGDVMPPAALAWRLQAADITLAEGQRPLPARRFGRPSGNCFAQRTSADRGAIGLAS